MSPIHRYNSLSCTGKPFLLSLHLIPPGLLCAHFNQISLELREETAHCDLPSKLEGQPLRPTERSQGKSLCSVLLFL